MTDAALPNDPVIVLIEDNGPTMTFEVDEEMGGAFSQPRCGTTGS